MLFSELRLAEPLLQALDQEGYASPTPIQAKAIPPILDGRDLLGCAQTGTGKTAAFSLPLLQRIMLGAHRPAHGQPRHVRALILSPTRELASQIGQSVRAYGGKTGVRYAVIFGGVGQGQQVDALRSGVDVLVATPGRLLDLMNQGHVDLRHVQVFVLDEADRMLDMGFIHDIRKIVARLPARRQNLMFSATMPAEIRQLANSILRDAAYVEVAPVSSTAERIEQSVYHVRKADKPQLLAHLYHDLPMARVLVFTRTKHGADKLVRKLRTSDIHAEAIHGNKAQNARQRAMNNFKSGKISVLVATDIAARGIDVDGITHVVNFDIPNEPETYVHRIGRTARAGASGVAISFCDEGDEKLFLRDIERLIRRKIEVCGDAPTFQREDRPTAHRQDRPYRSPDRSAQRPRAARPAHGARRAGSPGKPHAVQPRGPHAAPRMQPARRPAGRQHAFRGGW